MSGTTAAARGRGSYGVLIATIFAALLLLFLYSVAQVLILLFIAALFAVYLGAITDFLQHQLKVPRGVGLATAVVLTLTLLVGIGWLIVPPVLQQMQELVGALPALLTIWERDLRDMVGRYPLFAGMLPPADADGGYLAGILGGVSGYFAGIFPYVFGGLHILIDIFAVLVMGIYMTLRPALYRDGVVALAPPVHRELVRDILGELGNTLRSWLVGQIIAMIFLGVLTYIGLLALRVPFALAFGVFTGLAAIVPFFGTLVSTLLPAFFVLPTAGIGHALLVILLGVVVHLIEANIVLPIILQRQVHLPPVLSILSVLMMAELLGAFGLLVAVPVLATTLVIVRRIYIHRLLEGRGFRRSKRDAAVQIQLPASARWVHPSAAELNLTSLLEKLQSRPAAAPAGD
ncbi:hypothetical protein BH20GEM2_BH20GEM2_10860 [soil metagenome]